MHKSLVHLDRKKATTIVISKTVERPRYSTLKRFTVSADRSKHDVNFVFLEYLKSCKRTILGDTFD